MSKDLNQVIIIGRLTKDPEGTFAKNGTFIAKFPIANNTGYGEKQEVNFFDVTVFGKLAEVCTQYLKKGNQVALQGELKQSRWQGQDNQNHSKIEILCNNIQFLQKQEAKQGSQQQQSQNDFVPNPFDSDNVPF